MNPAIRQEVPGAASAALGCTDYGSSTDVVKYTRADHLTPKLPFPSHEMGVPLPGPYFLFLVVSNFTLYLFDFSFI